MTQQLDAIRRALTAHKRELIRLSKELDGVVVESDERAGEIREAEHVLSSLTWDLDFVINQLAKQ